MTVSLTGVQVARRYRLESRIAVGGLSEVWRAADTALDQAVAVKLLRQELASHPRALAEFRTRAERTRSVQHPAIASVFDYGEIPGMAPYLVLELVPGRALAEVLAAGPLGPERAMEVVAQTAAGLAAVHDAGLVHGDIKPSGLLIEPGGRLKMTGVGAGNGEITGGRSAYLAPERAAGWPATPASDLYSLGAIAHECLTGAPPSAGSARAARHAAAGAGPLPPPHVPADVAALVAELTAMPPAGRPASAAAIAARAGRLRSARVAAPAARPAARTSGGRHSRPRGPAPVPAPPAPRPPARTEVLPPTAPAPRQPTPDEIFRPAPPGQPALTEVLMPSAPVPDRRRSPARTRRIALFGLVGIIGVACLGGWILTSASHSAPAAAPSAPHASASTTASGTTAPHHAGHRKAGSRFVIVSSAALEGLPVDAVRWQLRHLGLRTRVVTAPSAKHPAGTVLSVSPSGKVRRGTTIVVTASYRPKRQHHSGHRKAGSRFVIVSSAALEGLPVAAVQWQLRHLGLRTRVVTAPSAKHPAGTVLSVSPSGKVRRGTTIVVTASYRPKRQHHGGGRHHHYHD